MSKQESNLAVIPNNENLTYQLIKISNLITKN